MIKQVLTLIAIFIGFAVSAQVESTAIGLRGGGISGMTIKKIDHDYSGFEILLGYQRHGMRLTGLIEKFKPIKTNRIANLYVYSGFGAHAGYVRYDEHKTKTVDEIPYYSARKVISPVIGADLILGIEYHFESVPFQISLDYKPYLEFFGEKIFRIDFWDIGFSLKYVLNN